MNEAWIQTSRPGRIIFRCRTHNHWLEGYIGTTCRRLVDYLNTDAAREVVTARAVSVSTDSGIRSGFLIDSAEISTTTILFAYPIEDAPRRPDIAARSNLRSERVVLGVGPYEIQGDVYLPRGSKGVLAATPRRFIVVAAATLLRVDSPGAPEKHDAICVNRQYVEYTGAIPSGALVGLARAQADRREAEDRDRLTATMLVAVERARVFGGNATGAIASGDKGNG